MGDMPMAVPKNSDYKYTGPAPPAGKRGIVSGPPPPPIGGPRNFVISVKFSIRLLKAREKRKPNKVIEKSVLIM